MRAFESADGRKCVIPAAIGPGKAAARIRIASRRPFRSLRGGTFEIRKGEYYYLGDNISSDILIAEP